MILSFQEPGHKGMIDFLGRMVGYYKREVARKFLVYGQLMRPAKFAALSPMPMLPYTSYEVTAKSGAEFPALMSGVFRYDDGELGLFVVNAGSEEVKFQLDVDPTRHGMPAGAIVNVYTISPAGASRQVLNKVKGIVPLEASLSGRHITMFRLKPTVR